MDANNNTQGINWPSGRTIFFDNNGIGQQIVFLKEMLFVGISIDKIILFTALSLNMLSN